LKSQGGALRQFSRCGCAKLKTVARSSTLIVLIDTRLCPAKETSKEEREDNAN
jgi:hypothetical protein